MTEELNDPNVGNPGESAEAFERRRIAQLNAQCAAQALNEADDRPMRENFGPKEGESWDTREATHEAIARMKAARGPSRVHAAGLGPAPPAHRLVPTPAPPSLPEVFDQNAKAEMGLMIQAVVGALASELRQTFADLKEDIDANTRLLGVMNAPMEAITNSHELAAASFEALRADIAHGIDTSPAIAQLSKLVDNAGLADAQSKAERRFEELAAAIAASLVETRQEVKAALDGVSLNMVQVLHLLERLLAREAREIKRRAAGA